MGARPRIVSLLPSATEIVCALGLRDRLVGVSHECDHPADVVGLPVVTASKVDARGSSRDIDRGIRGLVESGLGVYRIDADLLASLAPDLIVTQDQCDVCAVPYADVVEATRALAGRGTEIVSLRPTRIAEVWGDVERVGAAAGVASRGVAVADRLRDRLGELARRVERAVGATRPRLACIEWLDPLMAAGNWVPELAAIAGAAYDLVPAGEHSARLEWEALGASRPDVVCVMPCGFALDQTRRELPALVADPRWAALPAVRAGRAFAIDGNAYFNRPGPRLVESAEILAGLLHPDGLGQLVIPGAAERIAAGPAPAGAGPARVAPAA